MRMKRLINIPSFHVVAASKYVGTPLHLCMCKGYPGSICLEVSLYLQKRSFL